MIPKNISGKLGEKCAIEFLMKNGYKIIASNYRFPGAEIDVVAEEGGVLCFVEVKTRKNKNFGYASDAVDKKKIQKLILGARCFMQANPSYTTFRFDVLEVYGSVKMAGFAVDEINLIKNAFDV